MTSAASTADHQAAEDARERDMREMGELAALINAATAKLVLAAAEFDRTESWGSDGIRSCAHWLSVHAGFDHNAGSELIRVGRALGDLPLLSAALAAGEVSYDKARVATRVAIPADEHIWLELARQATGAQFSRICRAYRRSARTDDPAQAEAHLEQRSVSWYWADDGMLHLKGVLPPEDGAVVLAALRSVTDRRSEPSDATEPVLVPDPALSPQSARRADALAEPCRRALSAGGTDDTTPPAMTRTVVVHVDVGVLTGEGPDGRCDIEDGPALSAAAARRIGCDALVVPITERDGLPIDAGRLRRLVHTPLRRAIHARDHTCRFPGCAVPVQRTDAHHVTHWAQGGRTDMSNLLSLCGFHHGRLHDGAYAITADGGGAFTFHRANGEPIVRPAPTFDDGVATLRDRIDPPVDGTALFAQDAGAPLNLNYAVSVISDACEWATLAAARGGALVVCGDRQSVTPTEPARAGPAP